MLTDSQLQETAAAAAECERRHAGGPQLAAADTPQWVLALNMLAVGLQQRRRGASELPPGLSDPRQLLRRADELSRVGGPAEWPNELARLRLRALTLHNLGCCEGRCGQDEVAMLRVLTAGASAGGDGGCWGSPAAWANLSCLQLRQGRVAEAVASARAAVGLSAARVTAAQQQQDGGAAAAALAVHAAALHNLAAAVAQQPPRERDGDAERLLGDAVAAGAAAFGRGHPQAAALRRSAGRVARAAARRDALAWARFGAVAALSAERGAAPLTPRPLLVMTVTLEDEEDEAPATICAPDGTGVTLSPHEGPATLPPVPPAPPRPCASESASEVSSRPASVPHDVDPRRPLGATASSPTTQDVEETAEGQEEERALLRACGARSGTPHSLASSRDPDRHTGVLPTDYNTALELLQQRVSLATPPPGAPLRRPPSAGSSRAASRLPPVPTPPPGVRPGSSLRGGACDASAEEREQADDDDYDDDDDYSSSEAGRAASPARSPEQRRTLPQLQPQLQTLPLQPRAPPAEPGSERVATDPAAPPSPPGTRGAPARRPAPPDPPPPDAQPGGGGGAVPIRSQAGLAPAAVAAPAQGAAPGSAARPLSARPRRPSQSEPAPAPARPSTAGVQRQQHPAQQSGAGAKQQPPQRRRQSDEQRRVQHVPQPPAPAEGKLRRVSSELWELPESATQGERAELLGRLERRVEQLRKELGIGPPQSTPSLRQDSSVSSRLRGRTSSKRKSPGGAKTRPKGKKSVDLPPAEGEEDSPPGRAELLTTPVQISPEPSPLPPAATAPKAPGKAPLQRRPSAESVGGPSTRASQRQQSGAAPAPAAELPPQAGGGAVRIVIPGTAASSPQPLPAGDAMSSPASSTSKGKRKAGKDAGKKAKDESSRTDHVRSYMRMAQTRRAKERQDKIRRAQDAVQRRLAAEADVRRRYDSAQAIQDWWRNAQQWSVMRAARRERRSRALRVRLIQRISRGGTTRLRARAALGAAQRKAEAEQRALDEAARRIQGPMRGWAARYRWRRHIWPEVGVKRREQLLDRARRDRVYSAATDIQAVWRMFCTRRRFVPIFAFRRHLCACQIQRWFRELLRMKRVWRQRGRCERRRLAAVTTIQAAFRGREGRKEAAYRRLRLRML